VDPTIGAYAVDAVEKLQVEVAGKQANENKSRNSSAYAFGAARQLIASQAGRNFAMR